MPVSAGLGLYGLVNLLTRGALALVGLYAARDLGLSAAAAAALVATSVLAMRFGRVLVAPWVSHRPRPALASGFLLVALGLGALAAAGWVRALAWPAVLCLGVGYGVVVLVIKVALVARDDRRLRTLGLLAIALNVAAALGPAVFGLLFDHVGGRAVMAGGGLVAAAAAVVTLTRPGIGDMVPGAAGAAFVWRDLRWAGHRAVLGPLLVIVVGFVLYAQLATALPILTARAASPSAIGVVFVLNAVVVMAAQHPLTTLAARHASVAKAAPPVGLASFAAGFAVLAASAELGPILWATLLFSMGECLLLPFVEEHLSRVLEGVAGLAAVFTLTAAAMGAGETLGALVGVRAALADAATLTSFLQGLALLSIVSAGAAVLVRRISDGSVQPRHGTERENT